MPCGAGGLSWKSALRGSASVERRNAAARYVALADGRQGLLAVVAVAIHRGRATAMRGARRCGRRGAGAGVGGRAGHMEMRSGER